MKFHRIMIASLCLILLFGVGIGFRSLLTVHPPLPTTRPQVLSASVVATPLPFPPFGIQQKTSGCISQQALPDALCTPGAIFPDVTVSQICTPGYSASVRNVPESEKKAVYAAYGIVSHTAREYEVDHLVSLELGGSNDISNLWPEPADPVPGFHQKDIVENFLHAQVCAGRVSLQEAQQVIAHDWLSIFHQMRD